MKIRKLTVIIIGVVVMLSILFILNREKLEYLYYKVLISDSGPIPDPNDFTFYPDDKKGYIQFDPHKILANSDEDMMMGMKSINEDDYYANSISYNDISWSQDDFFRFANVMSRKIWKGNINLSTWSVNKLIFERNCSSTKMGFQRMVLTVFRPTKVGTTILYTSRYLLLEPLSGQAKWAGDGEFSTLYIFKRSEKFLPIASLSADQAVEIAERKGGNKVRSTVDNNCVISVNLIDHPFLRNQPDWSVEYGYGLFSILINTISDKDDYGK
jgi:hypothetical protein